MHGDRALRCAREAREDADERGFARTVGAKQAKKLAFLDVEADVVQCGEIAPCPAVVLGDGIYGNCCCHEPSIVGLRSIAAHCRGPVINLRVPQVKAQPRHTEQLNCAGAQAGHARRSFCL